MAKNDWMVALGAALGGGLEGYNKERDRQMENSKLQELIRRSRMQESEKGFARNEAGDVVPDVDFYTEGTPAYLRSNRIADLSAKKTSPKANNLLTADQLQRLRNLRPGEAVPDDLKAVIVSPSYNLSGSQGRATQGLSAATMRAQGYPIDVSIPDDYVIPTGALPWMIPGDNPPALAEKKISSGEDLAGQKLGADAAKLKAQQEFTAAENEKNRRAQMERERFKAGNKAGKGKAKDEAAAAMRSRAAQIVTEDIDRALAILGSSEWAAGPYAGQTKIVPGTPAYNLNNLLDTIRANISFDKLQEMRAASPTGGALGQVSDFENKLLQATAGKLDVTMDPEDFRLNLNRLKQQYDSVIHGNASNKRARGAGGARDQAPAASGGVKKFYSKSRNQTKLVYPDGREEIVDGKR